MKIKYIVGALVLGLLLAGAGVWFIGLLGKNDRLKKAGIYILGAWAVSDLVTITLASFFGWFET